MMSEAAGIEKSTGESIKPRNTQVNRAFHEDEVVNLQHYAQRNASIKFTYATFNRLLDDERKELKDCDSKIKESIKRKNTDSVSTSAPLPPAIVIKSRETTMITCKKVRKDFLLCQIEDLVE